MYKPLSLLSIFLLLTGCITGSNPEPSIIVHTKTIAHNIESFNKEKCPEKEFKPREEFETDIVVERDRGSIYKLYIKCRNNFFEYVDYIDNLPKN